MYTKKDDMHFQTLVKKNRLCKKRQAFKEKKK